MWSDDGWKVPAGGKSAGLYYNVHGVTSGFFDVVQPRLLLPLSLSYDHRVIDGAAAARFTSYLAQVLADMRRVLL